MRQGKLRRTKGGMINERGAISITFWTKMSKRPLRLSLSFGRTVTSFGQS